MNNQIAQLPNVSQDTATHQPPIKQPSVAFLHCYDLIEDYLDSIGVSLESYCHETTGGWLFNYIDALKTVGVHSVLFCITARVNEVQRITHAPTGATICLLPASKIYRAYRKIRTTRRRVLKMEGEFSASNTIQAPRRSLFKPLKSAVSTIGTYLSTPLGLLAQELQHERCQAILCQEYHYGRFDACVLLGQFIKLPVFATFQGGGYLPRSFIEYFIRPLSLNACAGLIISTQTELKRIQALYALPTNKIARIFSPVDVSSWGTPDRSKTRAELGISPQAKVVIYHGRIEIYNKGLDVLLDAWVRLCRDRPGQALWLLLVGTGSDADEFRKKIVATQLSNIVWRDEYINDRTLLRQYLAAADLYTLPSRSEGFPVAPIEAMACGLPVVAADAPGVPDILEGGEESGGLMVPREDSEALANALGRLLDDTSLAQELGNRGICRVEMYFSPTAIGRQLNNFLLN